jgi:hypothetical protein
MELAQPTHSHADSSQSLAALAEQNCCLQQLVAELLRKNELLRQQLAERSTAD